MSLPKSLSVKPNTITPVKKGSTVRVKATAAKKPKVYRGVNTPAKAVGYRLHIRSRHPSHASLRKSNIRLPFRTIVRFGSTSVGDGKPRIECNSVDAVKTSASKLLMKRAFQAVSVVTAQWWIFNNTNIFIANAIGDQGQALSTMEFPIVAKHIHGSRGEGNYLLKSQAEFNAWITGKTRSNYIFEKFYDYNREYRLHVTADGCFYTCRKMIKEGTPEENRWFRNDSNSVWILESNPKFDKPVNWNAIVAESVKALKAVGLDVGAIDVKVQSRTNADGAVRKEPKFIILETNSAPSFGDVTLEKYKEVIPTILKKKRGN